MTGETELDRLRDRLVEAVLPHVPFDGWTLTALRRSVGDAGCDLADAQRAFPHGSADMVEHFSRLADRRMVEALEAQDLADAGMTARVKAAIRIRLEQAAPNREAVQRAVAFLSMPQHATLGARCLYRTVDAIWRAAGDTATDWNFYSKRGLLAAVFSATVLYWLGDRSEGSADTWEFLDRRLADVAQFGRATGRFTKRMSGFTRPFGSFRTDRR